MNILKIDLKNSKDAAIYRKLLNEYALDPMGGGEPIAVEKLQKVTHDLSKMPHASVYLASKAGMPVGFATCFSAYSTFSAKPLTNIHDIAVLSEYRGQGIARAILQKIAQDAKQEGHCKVTLEVRVDNPIAEGLYQSEGFTVADFNGLKMQYIFLEKVL